MISYLITRIFIESFRLIPFWMLYGISDITWIFLFKIIGYRKKVIYENLEKAFPEKSKAEIRKIAHKFYRNFTDVLLESLKGFTMSKKSMLKRFKVIKHDFLDRLYDEGKSVLCLGAHYANWEYGTSIALHVPFETVTVYKAVKNKHLNKYMCQNRNRWGMKQISIEKTRVIFNRIDKPKFIILIADQNTPTLEKAIWINFLGIETPCIHGPEVYSSMFNYPVVFLDYQRVKRGYYTAEISLLSENPKSLEKGEITRMYMGKLEEVIRKKNEDWLWTHKRWKHKKEGDKILHDYYYKY
jgi:Kdo2-lipid IVA lauroyltransferase/acyltransferase